MTPQELQKKLSGFSVNYFLKDIRDDRDFYYSLTPEDINQFPGLYLGYLVNLFIEGKLDLANEKIQAMPQDSFFRMAIQLVNPTITWKEFIQILKIFKEKNLSMQSALVVTAGRPYLLNGFNDFTRIGPLLKRNRNIFIDVLNIMYGHDCAPAMFNLSLAEYYYQINELIDSELLISRTIKEFNTKSDFRLLFVSLYLEAKVFLANGGQFQTANFISNIHKQVTELGKAEFSNNINAVEVSFSFYEGNYEAISYWMKTDAPDEIGDFNMLDLYRYMIKIRCYIIQENYNPAISLIEKLRPLLKQGYRHMDLCEIDILLAIIMYKTGKKELAYIAFERALRTASRRKYYRLIADEGIAIFKLLIEYTKLTGETEIFTDLIEATRSMAIKYPRYLKPRYKNNEEFSQMEIDILNLLQQGKNQEEIGEYFFITVNTVKYHLKKIYAKLEAVNANQAVWNARLLGLIK